MDRPGTCIILDKKYSIANSSCHFGSYDSIWTGPSPKKYYMDHMVVYGPVRHQKILYGPQKLWYPRFYYIANSSWHWGSYGSIWTVRHQKNIIWTEASEVHIIFFWWRTGHMAVYGPVRHPNNIIWTEASEVHIIFFWWRTGSYTAIWPSVPWTICYIIKTWVSTLVLTTRFWNNLHRESKII
jgi:hypothetical protein